MNYLRLARFALKFRLALVEMLYAMENSNARASAVDETLYREASKKLWDGYRGIKDAQA